MYSLNDNAIKNDSNQLQRKVGSVTQAERDEIKKLFERKNGLIELFRSLLNISKEELEQSFLYERLVRDMGEVSTRFQAWWDEKSTKYHWESVKGHRWEIDFNTGDIYLRKNESQNN